MNKTPFFELILIEGEEKISGGQSIYDQKWHKWEVREINFSPFLLKILN